MTILVIATAIVAVIGGIFFFSKSNFVSLSTLAPSPSPTSVNKSIYITASFTIMTDKITRSFKAEKYHNQSAEVYITKEDPTIINVKKVGATWSDFFKTLPMKLTRECLITGDGENLCDGTNGSLKFYLNDVEDKNVLDQEIKEGVSFKNSLASNFKSFLKIKAKIC